MVEVEDPPPAHVVHTCLPQEVWHFHRSHQPSNGPSSAANQRSTTNSGVAQEQTLVSIRRSNPYSLRSSGRTHENGGEGAASGEPSDVRGDKHYDATTRPEDIYGDNEVDEGNSHMASARRRSSHGLGQFAFQPLIV